MFSGREGLIVYEDIKISSVHRTNFRDNICLPALTFISLRVEKAGVDAKKSTEVMMISVAQ